MKATIRTPLSLNVLPWRLNPDLDKYRILGQGEREEATDGNFIIPVILRLSELSELPSCVPRVAKFHCIARSFKLHCSVRGFGYDGRGIAVAITQLDLEGNPMSPDVTVLADLQRKLLSYTFDHSGYYIDYSGGYTLTEHYEEGTTIEANRLSMYRVIDTRRELDPKLRVLFGKALWRGAVVILYGTHTVNGIDE